MLCSTTAVTWFFSIQLSSVFGYSSTQMFVILLITLAFVGVAIACWSMLQVAPVDKAQEQATEQFQAVLDAVPAQIYWVSSNLKYLGVNHQLARAFDLCPEDFIGQPIDLNSSPERIEFVRDFFAKPATRSSLEINT